MDPVFNVSFQAPNTDSKNININNLSLNIDKKIIFKDTTLNLLTNHVYGLIGINGSGKSSLLRTIAKRELPISQDSVIQLIEQETNEEFLNETVFDTILKSDEKLYSLLELSKTEQDFDTLQTIEEELKSKDAFKTESKIKKILYGLGFGDKIYDKVSSFSGGWRKRIALAKAVFMEPDILLLDEPTNHLDLNSVIWLGCYLTKVYKNNDKILIIVSHDSSFLDSICTNILRINNAKIEKYNGNYSSAIQQIEKDKNIVIKDLKFSNELRKSLIKKGISKKDIDSKISEHFKKKKYSDGAPVKEKQYKVMFPWEKPQELRNGNILSAENISFGYDDSYILENINFSIQSDSRIALVGPNGCGKTTFIDILARKLKPNKGTILVDRHYRVGVYSQHFEDYLPFNITPINYMKNCGINNEFDARAKLGTFGLGGNTHNQNISTLSGGQKVRVAFAGISASHPHTIILDEPTNHLDIDSIKALAESLVLFKGGVLVITHDVNFIKILGAELYIINDKNLIKFDGDIDDYRNELLESV